MSFLKNGRNDKWSKIAGLTSISLWEKRENVARLILGLCDLFLKQNIFLFAFSYFCFRKFAKFHDITSKKFVLSLNFPILVTFIT